MGDFYLGIDLGGTKIMSALANEEGKILESLKTPTEADGGEKRVINNIINSIIILLGKFSLDKSQVGGIGICSPGLLNTAEGIIYESSNIPWKNVKIVKILEDELNIPVFLENDANAAALAESNFGAGFNYKNMIYITVSTGIGGGIVIDNKLYHGANNNAGEIGHMTVVPDGPLCGCGNHGCFEAVASGTALKRMAIDGLDKNQGSLINKLSEARSEEIDGKLIALAARKGDEFALRLFKRLAYYLGIGLANLINIFNPELIVLGGGVMKSYDFFWDEMKNNIERRALSVSLKELEIVRSKFEDDSGVMGALTVAINKNKLT